jgi:hypothetical protein
MYVSRQIGPPSAPLVSLHSPQNDGAFDLLWWGRYVKKLPDKRAQVSFTLGTVGTRETILQVGLDIQAFFDF